MPACSPPVPGILRGSLGDPERNFSSLTNHDGWASVFRLVLQEPHLRHQAKTHGWLKDIVTGDSGLPEDREADGAWSTTKVKPSSSLK